MNGNLVVLLTATVRPHTALSVSVAEPETRAEQYRWAIRKWAKVVQQCNGQLYVAENSESASTIWVNEPKVSYMDIPRDTSASLGDRGKGYLEAQLLVNALALLASQNLVARDDVLLKCTGRLAVSNAVSLLKNTNPNAIRCLVSNDRRWLDTRVLVSSVEPMTQLFEDLAETIDERTGSFMEHAAYDRARARQLLLHPFQRPPAFLGVSGSTGKVYGSTIHRMVRPLVPSIVLRRSWSYWGSPGPLPLGERLRADSGGPS